jgi:hypothetical protein
VAFATSNGPLHRREKAFDKGTQTCTGRSCECTALIVAFDPPDASGFLTYRLASNALRSHSIPPSSKATRSSGTSAGYSDSATGRFVPRDAGEQLVVVDRSDRATETRTGPATPCADVDEDEPLVFFTHREADFARAVAYIAGGAAQAAAFEVGASGVFIAMSGADRHLRFP